MLAHQFEEARFTMSKVQVLHASSRSILWQGRGLGASGSPNATVTAFVPKQTEGVQ